MRECCRYCWRQLVYRGSPLAGTASVVALVHPSLLPEEPARSLRPVSRLGQSPLQLNCLNLLPLLEHQPTEGGIRIHQTVVGLGPPPRSPSLWTKSVRITNRTSRQKPQLITLRLSVCTESDSMFYTIRCGGARPRHGIEIRMQYEIARHRPLYVTHHDCALATIFPCISDLARCSAQSAAPAAVWKDLQARYQSVKGQQEGKKVNTEHTDKEIIKIIMVITITIIIITIMIW